MHVEVLGYLGVDLFQECQELGGAMARMQGTDDFAGREVQGGIEARGAVADVVMAGPRRAAGQHREHRLGPVERLDLRFRACLIDCVRGWA